MHYQKNHTMKNMQMHFQNLNKKFNITIWDIVQTMRILKTQTHNKTHKWVERIQTAAFHFAQLGVWWICFVVCVVDNEKQSYFTFGNFSRLYSNCSDHRCLYWTCGLVCSNYSISFCNFLIVLTVVIWKMTFANKKYNDSSDGISQYFF